MYEPHLDDAAVAPIAALPDEEMPRRTSAHRCRAWLAGLVFLIPVLGATLLSITTEAVWGSGAAIVLLLIAFGFVYTRSFQARRRAEALAAHLRDREAHLQQAQRLAGLGSWEWDAPSRTLFCSAEHARMLGFGDGLPQTLEQLLANVEPEDRDRVGRELSSALEEGQAVETDYRLKDPSGDRLMHLEVELTIGSDGRRSRLIGTCRDVTERFLRVEAERANQAKSEFLSRVSHELRTPLNAILGYSQLLTVDELSERQHSNAERIVGAGRHLLELITEILDISRIETGWLKLTAEPVSVACVIRDATGLVSSQAEAKGVEITTGPGVAGSWVLADAGRLRQVLLNLLSNAVKYNRDGGHVIVSASQLGDRWQISVADDGPGIAASMLGDLFRPFERLGAEETAIEGTGLGLSLAKGMVEAMGGTIAVRSDAGQGAVFTVELERVTPAAMQAPAPHRSVAAAPTTVTAVAAVAARGRRGRRERRGRRGCGVHRG